MPSYYPNPFLSDSPAFPVYETLTSLRSHNAPLLPKSVFKPEMSADINGLFQANTISYNVAALLHLLNDDLDQSHVLCQAHEDDATANYIHQLVHRREGDFGNTRYWVLKTGAHPFYAELTDLAASVGGSRWNANEMVTWATRGEHFATRLNDTETQGLLVWCVKNNR